MQPLDTAALTLRPVRLSDAARIHEWASLEVASRYQPWGPNSLAETEQFVRLAEAAWSTDPRVRHVFAAEAPGTQIGETDGRQVVVGLGELKLTHARWRSGEIAYAVHTDLWGRGIARGIAGMLCDLGFAAFGLERIAATCDPRNVASAAVLERIGMAYEGTIRRAMYVKDGWRDSRLYSLIRPEWPSRRGPDTLARVSGI